MGAADDRVAELLDRWLASIELHARYVDLDDDAYARVQDWPRHRRPTRWIVDLARARCLELKRLLAERTARSDPGYAESLELMAFLTSLLGSEHVERFIPLAAPPGSKPPRPAEPEPAAVPRARTPPAPRAGPKARPAPSARAQARPVPAPSPDAEAATVIADAVRLLKWGREWPQLASLICRLADRPAEQEVWAILRRYRTDIEAQASRPPA